MFLAAAVLTTGMIAAWLPVPRARRLIAALLVSLEALVLFALPELSAPRDVQVDRAAVTFLQHHLGLSRFFTLGPLQPNYGSYYAIASLNADDIPVPSEFGRFVNTQLDPAVNPLIFNGTPPGRPPSAPSPQKELTDHLPGYRNAAVQYVLAPAGLALPQAPSTFTLVAQTPTTWIYRLADPASYFTASDPGCVLRARTRTSARVSCSRRASLVRRETYMPGWSAQIDGHATAIRRYGGVFQSITVKPGTHRVTFSYAPPYVGLGVVAFVAGCIWLLLAPLAARTKPNAGRGRQTRLAVPPTKDPSPSSR